MMRTLLSLAVLLVGMAVSTSVWAVEQEATSLSEVKVFRNVSGASTTHGTAFVLQQADTDSNVIIGATKGSETTLGMDVTTTTSADVGTFIGCQVDDTCADDALCRVVTWGPAICIWNGTDNTNTRMATVGTTTTAGQLGSGTLAGLTMSLTLSPAGTEDVEGNSTLAVNELRWIWVSPDNN